MLACNSASVLFISECHCDLALAIFITLTTDLMITLQASDNTGVGAGSLLVSNVEFIKERLNQFLNSRPDLA